MARGILAAFVLCLALPVAADDKLPVQVQLADGSTVMLRNWSLSYEYLAWKLGTSPALATPARRVTTGIWCGKKDVPVAGQVLTVLYQEVPREREVDGKAETVKVAQARAITLGAGSGKATEQKIESPPRDFLVPDADKKLSITARSLDLRGETLTGTKRELCLVTYSALVECGENPADRVTRVEFP